MTTKSSITPGHHCCGIQKKQLVKDLAECRNTTDSAASRHSCFRRVAKASKKQARACLYS